MHFTFEKSAPLNKCFQRCFKSFLSPFHGKRLSQRATVYPAYTTDLISDLHLRKQNFTTIMRAGGSLNNQTIK